MTPAGMGSGGRAAGAPGRVDVAALKRDTDLLALIGRHTRLRQVAATPAASTPAPAPSPAAPTACTSSRRRGSGAPRRCSRPTAGRTASRSSAGATASPSARPSGASIRALASGPTAALPGRRRTPSGRPRMPLCFFLPKLQPYIGQKTDGPAGPRSQAPLRPAAAPAAVAPQRPALSTAGGLAGPAERFLARCKGGPVVARRRAHPDIPPRPRPARRDAARLAHRLEPARAPRPRGRVGPPRGPSGRSGCPGGSCCRGSSTASRVELRVRQRGRDPAVDDVAKAERYRKVRLLACAVLFGADRLAGRRAACSPRASSTRCCSGRRRATWWAWPPWGARRRDSTSAPPRPSCPSRPSWSPTTPTPVAGGNGCPARPLPTDAWCGAGPATAT